MVGRKVAPLMDNFSAHEAAVSEIQLQNTLIIWLPANSTSRYQPLDQGINRTWKAYWKRQWNRYLMHEFHQQRDPLSTMNLLKAIRWGSEAWSLDITAETIQNCFQRAMKKKT
jgi:hypothetical protein